LFAIQIIWKQKMDEVLLAMAIRVLVASNYPLVFCWKQFGFFFLAALIVAVPLIIYLTVINPSAEARVADLSGPLNQLRAGNPGEVIQSTLNTLGMFTYRGDAVPIYTSAAARCFRKSSGQRCSSAGC
jgi:hypothetical protein